MTMFLYYVLFSGYAILLCNQVRLMEHLWHAFNGNEITCQQRPQINHLDDTNGVNYKTECFAGNGIIFDINDRSWLIDA